MRRLVGFSAVVAAIVGIVATAPAGAAGSTPSCRTSGLSIWFDNQLNGTAGTLFYGLKFTNLSGHKCTLRGYPGVSAVNTAGRRVGAPASRMTGHPVRTITLANGGTATADVGIVDVGAIPPSSCRAVTAAGFRVFPPNQRASRIVPFPFPTCSTSTSSLRILPVARKRVG